MLLADIYDDVFVFVTHNESWEYWRHLIYFEWSPEMCKQKSYSGGLP